MRMQAEIRYTGIVGMGRREFRNEFIKPMFESMGLLWMLEIRPKHFTHAGGTEYGYQPRTVKYNMQKLRKVGHTYPLRYRDELRAASRFARYQHRRQGMDIVMNRAQKANFRRTPKAPNMRDELTRVSESDANKLIRHGNRFMEAKMRSVPRSRRITIN